MFFKGNEAAENVTFLEMQTITLFCVIILDQNERRMQFLHFKNKGSSVVQFFFFGKPVKGFLVVWKPVTMVD